MSDGKFGMFRYQNMELKDAAEFADQQSTDFTDNNLLPIKRGPRRVATQPTATHITESQLDGVDRSSNPSQTSPTSPADRLQQFRPIRFALNTAKEVRNFVEFPFSPASPDQQAADTLAALEPFFWLLRALGLCSLVSIFSSTPIPLTDRVQKRWNTGLLVYCITVGIFLWLGFFATFGFSLAWPVAFCAGFQTVMANQSYCKADIMSRFLTPTGMATIVQVIEFSKHTLTQSF